MSQWDERRPVSSLQQLAETMGAVLRLIDEASPSGYSELEALTQTLRNDLEKARAQALSSDGLQNLTREQQSAFSTTVIDAWERMQASRWNASRNRDFEHLLRELQDTLAACARELA